MYFDITGIIVTIIVTLVLAVIGNLLTRPVERWWAERSRRNAKYYISSKTKFLREIEEYKTNPETYQRQLVIHMATIFRDVIAFSGLLLPFAVGSWLLASNNRAIGQTWVMYISGGLFLLFVYMLLYLLILVRDYLRLTRILHAMSPFDTSKEKMIAQINLLRQKYPDNSKST